jgi:exosortase
MVTRMVEFISHNILMIEVRRQGTMLIDPSGRYQYEVAAACSGIRSLIATAAFSFILAFVSLRTWWKRLVMIGAGLPLAVLGNLLRMLAIIIAADLGGAKWGNVVHEGGPGGIFVLMLYVPSFAGLLLLEHFLRKRQLNANPPPLEAKTA